MSDPEWMRKIREVERLLNDPEIALDPAKVWSLLAEISGAQQPEASPPGTAEALPSARPSPASGQ